MHMVGCREESKKPEQKEPDDCGNTEPSYYSGMSTVILDTLTESVPVRKPNNVR